MAKKRKAKRATPKKKLPPVHPGEVLREDWERAQPDASPPKPLS